MIMRFLGLTRQHLEFESELNEALARVFVSGEFYSRC